METSESNSHSDAIVVKRAPRRAGATIGRGPGRSRRHRGAGVPRALPVGSELPRLSRRQGALPDTPARPGVHGLRGGRRLTAPAGLENDPQAELGLPLGAHPGGPEPELGIRSAPVVKHRLLLVGAGHPEGRGVSSLWWNPGERRERPVLPVGARRPADKAREGGAPTGELARVYFDRNATQSAAKRQFSRWGGGSGGMDRRSNAAWVSPQAVKHIEDLDERFELGAAEVKALREPEIEVRPGVVARAVHRRERPAIKDLALDTVVPPATRDPEKGKPPLSPRCAGILDSGRLQFKENRKTCRRTADWITGSPW